jgi:hypothetical protein
MKSNVLMSPSDQMIQDIVSSSFSPPYEGNSGFAVQANWIGNPVGSIRLQASMDDMDHLIWADIPSTAQPVTGTNGSFIWNIPYARYRYVRVKYTFGAGSGTLEINRNTGRVDQ